MGFNSGFKGLRKLACPLTALLAVLKVTRLFAGT
jgi:hypothetical protein